MKTSSAQTPQIIHVTENTGDRQSFDLTDANFDPAALAKVPDLIHTEIGGFRLIVSRNGDLEIKVLYHGRLLTCNRVVRQGCDIVLSTRVVGIASGEVMMMAADLEQCAAIALLED